MPLHLYGWRCDAGDDSRRRRLADVPGIYDLLTPTSAPIRRPESDIGSQ